jgi:hypothetical protein
MEEKNAQNSNAQPQNGASGNNNKPMGSATIVAYNILALVFYTIICKLTANQGGFIFDAFFIFLHVLVCFALAIGKKSLMWALSAVLVLLIGFSTCYMLASTG